MKETVKNITVGKVIKGALPIVLLIGLLCTYFFFFRFVEVSGQSMYPTYEDGTTLFVQVRGEVHRGDVVAVYSTMLREDLCKRVIGIGGDRIEIRKGVVKVNGEPLKETFNEGDVTNMGERVVPQGHIFVLGDNRTNSTDSRRIGAIPIEDIKAKVLVDLHIPYRYLTGAVFFVFVLLFLRFLWHNLQLKSRIEVYNPDGRTDYDIRLRRYNEVETISDLSRPYVVFVSEYDTDILPEGEEYGYKYYNAKLIKAEMMQKIMRNKNFVENTEQTTENIESE